MFALYIGVYFSVISDCAPKLRQIDQCYIDTEHSFTTFTRLIRVITFHSLSYRKHVFVVKYRIWYTNLLNFYICYLLFNYFNYELTTHLVSKNVRDINFKQISDFQRGEPDISVLFQIKGTLSGRFLLEPETHLTNMFNYCFQV